MLNDTNNEFGRPALEDGPEKRHAPEAEALDIAELNQAKDRLLASHPQIATTINNAFELLVAGYNSPDTAFRDRARNLVRGGREGREGASMDDVLKTLIMADLERAGGNHANMVLGRRSSAASEISL